MIAQPWLLLHEVRCAESNEAVGQKNGAFLNRYAVYVTGNLIELIFWGKCQSSFSGTQWETLQFDVTEPPSRDQKSNLIPQKSNTTMMKMFQIHNNSSVLMRVRSTKNEILSVSFFAGITTRLRMRCQKQIITRVH